MSSTGASLFSDLVETPTSPLPSLFSDLVDPSAPGVSRGDSIAERRAVLARSQADLESWRTQTSASLRSMPGSLDGFQKPRNQKIAADGAALQSSAADLQAQQTALDPDDVDAARAYNEAFRVHTQRADDFQNLVDDTQAQVRAKVGRVRGAIDAFAQDDASRVAGFNAQVADFNAAVKREGARQRAAAQARAQAAAQAEAARQRQASAVPSDAERVRAYFNHRLNVAYHTAKTALPGQGDAEASQDQFLIPRILKSLDKHPELASLYLKQAGVDPKKYPARAARLGALVAERTPGVSLDAYRDSINPKLPPRMPTLDFGTATSRLESPPPPSALAGNLRAGFTTSTGLAASSAFRSAAPRGPIEPVDFTPLLQAQAREIDGHEYRQVQSLKALSFDPVVFLNAVRQRRSVVATHDLDGDKVVAAGEQLGLFSSDADRAAQQAARDDPYRSIDIENAAFQIGRSLGLDSKRCHDLLDPKSKAFALLRAAVRRGAGVSDRGDNPRGAAIQSGASGVSYALMRQHPNIANQTDAGLYADALGMVMAPFSQGRALLGDARTSDELPLWENVFYHVGDLLPLILSGGVGAVVAKTGSAVAARAATAELAGRLVPEMVSSLAEKAAGSAMGRGLARAGATGAGRLGGHVLKVGAENAAFGLLPAFGQASDLTAQNGKSYGENLGKVSAETALGLARQYNPGVFFDPNASIDEKIGAGIAQGMLLAGGALKGYGLVEANRAEAARPDPLLVRALEEEGRLQGRRNATASPDFAASQLGALGLTDEAAPRQSEAPVGRRRALDPAPVRVGPAQKAAERSLVHASLEIGLTHAQTEFVRDRWRDLAARHEATGGGDRESFYAAANARFRAVSPEEAGAGRGSDVLEQRKPGPYEFHKKGDDPYSFSEADYDDMVGRHMNPETGKIPLTIVAADLANVGSYHNKETGAWAPGRQDPITGKWALGSGGGVEGDLLPDYYGHTAWKSEKPAINSIGKAVRNSGGLMVAHSTGPDAIFSSAHSTAVLGAEIKASIKSGVGTKRQFVDLFRSVYEELRGGEWKEDVERSPLKYPESKYLPHVEDYLYLMDRGHMGMAQRNRMFLMILRRGAQYKLLPKRRVVRRLMTSPTFRETPPGHTLAVMQADRRGIVGPATDFGLPDPIAYKHVLLGTSMGLTDGVHLRELIPDVFARVEDYYREKYADRPGFVTKGRVYSGTRQYLDRPGWGNFYGETDADTLRRLIRRRTDADDAADPGGRHDGPMALLDPRSAAGVDREKPGGLRPDGPADRRADAQAAQGRTDAGRGSLGRAEPAGPGRSGGSGRTERVRGRLEPGTEIQEQRDAGVLRGYAAFTPGERTVVGLIRGRADLGTLLHESAHVWRRVLPPQDLTALERHFGVRDGRWSVGHEEAFARGVEAYFRTGKSPALALKGPLSRLRAWFGDLVGRSGIEPGDLHPEMRRMLDRTFKGGMTSASPSPEFRPLPLRGDLSPRKDEQDRDRSR